MIFQIVCTFDCTAPSGDDDSEEVSVEAVGFSHVYVFLLLHIRFLAHLSRRLVGELIVYTGIRPSTFSNDISSEAVRPILPKFHI